MRRPGLVLATVALLLLTGLTLVHAGWFEQSKPVPQRPEGSFATDVPWTWQCGGTRHWRGCVMNP